jgi:hypothetical protein
MARILDYNAANPKYVLTIDQAGNGDYDNIQGAINYANTQTPSSTQQWLIYVPPGYYEENLTLYDYINIAGISPDSSFILAPPEGSAIGNFAKCVISNMRITSSYDLAIKSGSGSAGKMLTLRNVTCEDSTELLDLIEITTGSLIIDRCNLQIGGSLQLVAGTLKIWDSIITHYHTNGSAATEHTIEVAAGTTLEIIRSSIYNTSPKGSAVYFSGNPTSCKILHSIFKKSAAATYSLDAGAAVSITMNRCIINAVLNSSITITGMNDLDASI